MDTTLRKATTGAFDVPVQCFYKGDAAHEHQETSPYLIDMTLPDEATINDEKVPAFHKDLFRKHWGTRSGTFIRTVASARDVLKHFRHFPRIEVESDKRWVFLRFWPSRIASSYFPKTGKDQKILQSISHQMPKWWNYRSLLKVTTVVW